MRESQTLFFYQTQGEACGYLDGMRSRNLLADPHFPMSPAIYRQLIERGFRRSGNHVYRPYCAHCDACVPVRVPVANFVANRSQRRCLRHNADVRVKQLEGRYSDEYFDLYRRYLASRHPGGGMDDPTPESFRRFLLCDWCDTRFFEFRRDGELLAVAVSDALPDALSAVYTFFEPQAPARRALGKLAVLWQLQESHRSGLQQLYLGYWIEDCEKMRYKTDYRPLQYYDGRRWRGYDGPVERTICDIPARD